MQYLFKKVNQLNISLKSYQDTKIAKHFPFIALSNFYMLSGHSQFIILFFFFNIAFTLIWSLPCLFRCLTYNIESAVAFALLKK